ncbi:GNAT family N-acetyltransferase [Helicobacter cholecystus]|uniref:GNAT family N-acetyltransferase n=1 Tax=Helicobacter cholecystus TaxID=45498 RepID=A0A3D8IWM4_9HELI|nr:bifunctional UDP-2,4-diacetamido-2,4,6-trideoxy-beta-L-altropyranose hydrolase/GNAT family N-acetyltransferase [Helicobacter cholecystus]RDU69668.1 GNAT family N-acetyltransferase [Helicobacter cholecystus]VEJ24232.1 CMP-N-acetylneuraminic acid synthetase [Helicobacter cholecystus]
MRIDIFCESGEKYGLGHLRRCENLLLHLQEVFPSLEFKVTFHSCFTPLVSDIVIIDSYIAPLSFYESIKCEILICLDDFHRLSYPKNALILRPTLGAKTFAKSYGGSEYVILHPVFLGPKRKQTQKGKVLIHLGGSQQTSLISHILSTLHTEVHIINPYFKHSHYKTYHALCAQEICDLIDSSEIVICAGGGGMNEALSRGKKIIALCIANNQRTQLLHTPPLPSIFTFFSLSNLSCKLSYALKILDTLPPAKPLSLGNRLKPWLYKTLLPLISAKNALHFSLLTHKQKLEVLSLRNQKEVRENSLNPCIISAKEHFAFISSLHFCDFFWAFFENEEKKGEIIAVGSLSLKPDLKATLGIYKNIRYKHIGEKILHLLFQSAKKLNVRTIEVEVLKTNAKAIYLYSKLGFLTQKEKENSLMMEKRL